MINNYKECLNVFKIYLKYKKKIYLTWKNVFYKKYSSIFSLRIIIINMYCQNLFKALRKKINLKIKQLQLVITKLYKFKCKNPNEWMI